MRNLIYLITLTTILSLIGCNGLLGQGSGSGQVEKESNLDFVISNSLSLFCICFDSPTLTNLSSI